MDIIVGIIGLVIAIVVIAGMWKVFEKAGEPGWACIIPIYGTMVLAKIAKKPMWWGLLPLIPYVGFIWSIWIINLVAKNFGKGVGMTIALIFVVGWPILGFGDAEYIGDGEVDVASFGTTTPDVNMES